MSPLSRDALPRPTRPTILGHAFVGLITLSLMVVGPALATRSDVATGPDTTATGGPDTAVVVRGGASAADVAAMTESIRQKQQATIDETCAALDEVVASGLVEPGSMKHQQAQCDVGQRNAGSVSDDDIQSIALKRGASATAFAEYSGPNRDQPPAEGDPVVPSWQPGSVTLEDAAYLGGSYAYDGDGDGVCNAHGADRAPEVAAAPGGHGRKLNGFTEWCAEVVGDAVGDDDGFCEMHNPAGSERAFDERCVTVELTYDAMTADTENLDTERLADYDGLLGEAEATATEFHLATTQAIEALAEPVVEAAGTKGCPANTDRLKEQGIALGIMTGLAVGLEGIADTIGSFTNQTVVAVGFGGNSSSALAPLNGAAAAAQIVASALNVTADADTAVNVTNTLECLDAFRGESDQAMTQLSDDVAALSALSIEIVELKERVSYLLTATLSGQPVSGVTLTSVRASARSPLRFQALSMPVDRWVEVPGAPGTYQADLTLPPALSSAGVFVFDVVYQGSDGPIYGHALYDRASSIPVTTK
jgi:hypothetical protein